MHNLGFYGLLNYIPLPPINTIQYLQKILNNPQINNGNVLDLINYEKLITIEMQNKNNEEVQILCNQIKQIIADNYINKQKLLIRLER